MVNATALEFDQVVKTYAHPLFPGRGVRALRGVSFTVPAGESAALLGPNRAGKSTALKILLSVCSATSGRAYRLGRPVAERDTLGRVGYVHENAAFPRYLTARGLLAYYGDLTLADPAAVARRAGPLLERVGLADRADEPIARFSKGMSQRLALAQALLVEPDLLVLDEPAEGLDLLGRDLVRDVVAEQLGRGGGVILVSHLLADVERLCRRAVVLVDGAVAFDGGLDELRRDPAGGPPRPLDDALGDLYRKGSR